MNTCKAIALRLASASASSKAEKNGGGENAGSSAPVRFRGESVARSMWRAEGQQRARRLIRAGWSTRTSTQALCPKRNANRAEVLLTAGAGRKEDGGDSPPAPFSPK